MTPHRKAEARALVRRALDQPAPPGIRERAVRINSVQSGLAEGDLTEVVSSDFLFFFLKRHQILHLLPRYHRGADNPPQLQSSNLTTIVVPKVHSASDLTFVTDVINHTLSSQPQQQQRPPISLLALIESAKAITNLNQICASTPLLQGLIFAAEDFALDLNLTRTPSLTEFLFARSAIVTAARAHDLPSTIDLVFPQYKSLSQPGGRSGKEKLLLEHECRDGKRLGFNGKQCIHPSQVETVQRIFSPEHAEVEWAVRVVVADEKAAAAGRGAWSLDGKMIDAPVAEKARAIVRRAEACGIDVRAARERWKGQEPE